MAAKNARSGIALIFAMVILAAISALAAAMAVFAYANVQIADNGTKASGALSAAQSGLEIISGVLDGTNASSGSGCISSIASSLTSKLAAQSITGITFASTSSAINFASITLDSAAGQSFTASLSQVDSNTVRLAVSGLCGGFSKTITADFNIVSRGNSVFNYGIATRGALQMSGQAEVDGVDIAVASGVYIDGGIAGNSFTISGQASVGGNVYIADEYATASVSGQAKVGGASGSAAYNHIITGSPPAEFPAPYPESLEYLATGTVITSQSQIDSSTVFNNAKIAPNTNPTFAGSTTINGILYIEQPNIVTFSGQATVNGIIVGEGAVGASTADNKLMFSGQVDCFDVSTLSGEEFDAVKEYSGTFILAPGFYAEFSGQTDVANGVIAASGIKFSGQAGGNVNGSMLNYSPTQPIILTGQSSLFFNRSGTEINPAGFAPVSELDYLPQTYNEPAI